jgi:hypothetical protein
MDNWENLNYYDRIKKLEEKRNVFPKGTGNYQKYNNAINALKLLNKNIKNL